MRKNILLLLFLMLFLTAGNSADIIPKIRLTAGKADTIRISDLYFAENYSPQFLPNGQIKVRYLPEQSAAVLQPDSQMVGLSLIRFMERGDTMAIPVLVKRKYWKRFRFPAESADAPVFLFGSFNNWNRESLPLTLSADSREWICTVGLFPGRYEYKFRVGEQEILDPFNPDSVPNPFGAYNSLLNITDERPNKCFLYRLGAEQTKSGWRLSFLFVSDADKQVLNRKNILALLDNKPLNAGQLRVRDNQIDVYLSQRQVTQFRFLRIAVNQSRQNTHFQWVALFRLGDRESAWRDWRDAIIYSIMVDRFFDGNPANNRPVRHPQLPQKSNFYGGDLAGIRQKLQEGYFDSLGVNVLWLSPVIQNPDSAYQEFPPPHRFTTGYHGYWPVHPRKVDDRFGSLADIRQLTENAHRKGMKVILDFVANHVHKLHPYYREHPDWFAPLELPDGRKNIRFWDEYRLTTWFDVFLPSFDFVRSREAVRQVTEDALWWLEETGVDGFRQDAVKHIPNHFWREMTRKIKKEVELPRGYSIYQIGETFGNYDLISSYVNNGQLNAQFNFNLYDVALPVFLNPEMSFEELDAEMKRTFEVYGMFHLMGNLMDSHDKVRFMAYADGDLRLGVGDAQEIGWKNPPQVDDTLSYRKSQLYLAYLLSIPGIPVIYYGDEIGLTGAADPDNRRPMRFNEQLNPAERKMLREVRRLIHLRREHVALRYGDFVTALAEKEIYAYWRGDFTEKILVVLNKSAEKRTVSLPIPRFLAGSRLVDLQDGTPVPITNNTCRIVLPAFGFGFFKLK